MAIIYQSKDVNLLLNGNSIFCDNFSLSQQADISQSYEIDEQVSFTDITNGPVRNELNFSYFYTGRDFLQDYIYTKTDYPITGKITNLNFNQGYLKSYSLNLTPQSLILVNASLLICDELSGSLNKIVPSGPPTGVRPWTTNDIAFNVGTNFSAFNVLDNNFETISWDYNADVEPIYYQKETGLSHINPDRIYISNKNITCNISTKDINSNLLLPYSGQNFNLEVVTNNSTLTTLASGQGNGTSQDGALNLTIIDINKTGILEKGQYTITGFEYKFTSNVDSTGTVYPLVAIKTGSIYLPIAIGSGITYSNGTTSMVSAGFGPINTFNLQTRNTVFGGFHWSGATSKLCPIATTPDGAGGNSFLFYDGTENLPQALSPITSSSTGIFARNYNFLIKIKSNPSVICAISGKINKKDFSVGVGQIGTVNYTIKQSHLNDVPKIGSIDISTYPSNNYILINSINSTNNGFFSNENNLPLVKKIKLGGQDLKFNLQRKIPYDTITGNIPNDAINGDLEIQTTKGIIVYPSGLILNFSGIGVSGFAPITGNYRDTILISGTNFFKISQVLFNNSPANFQIKQNTGIGGFHELIASVPDSATVGNITILSTLKNRSGISTSVFYPLPVITGFTPTGMFSGFYFIGGKNFSGVTNVYFNNINASTLTVVNNNLITGLLPGTGKGYAKGYVKLSGFLGMESPLSNNIYQPVVPIYGLSAPSGTEAEDFSISTIVDTGYFCPVGDGFKVSFGRITGVFYPSGTGALTGLIPSGFFNSSYVSIYEPDGVGKYPPYTGKILQVGPVPLIETIYPEEINQYQKYTLNLEGKYFKDFFGINTYAIISGARTDPPSHDKYSFNAIVTSNSQSKVQITGVRITGATGYYDINLINYVGTGNFTGLKVISGIDWADTQAAAAHSPNNAFDTNNGADKAVDGNGSTSNSYSSTIPIGGNTFREEGWFTLTFNQPIDVNKINFYQRINGAFANQNTTRTFTSVLGGTANLTTTGMIQFFDNSLTTAVSGEINWNNTGYNYLASPYTGIRAIKLYRKHPLAPTTNKVFLSWNTIQVY